MQKIRILLVDDHAVLRSGLRLLINSQADMEVVGERGNGNEVFEALDDLKPDILLLDLALPGMDGIAVIKALRESGKTVKVLVLTMYEEEGYLKSAIESGADGYLLKKAADSELLTALRMVAQNARYVDPAVAGNLVSRIWSGKNSKTRDLKQELSDREREVLKYIALGFTNKQIASELVVSVKTVESHKANIKFKLNLNKRSELVRYAIEHKVI